MSYISEYSTIFTTLNGESSTINKTILSNYKQARMIYNGAPIPILWMIIPNFRFSILFIFYLYYKKQSIELVCLVCLSTSSLIPLGLVSRLQFSLFLCNLICDEKFHQG
uniref:Uncharacterized protein n=1 Tax=Cacopsylla melanoneura TaxID=428564 RepID=A0A8D8W885_9HEMI